VVEPPVGADVDDDGPLSEEPADPPPPQPARSIAKSARSARVAVDLDFDILVIDAGGIGRWPTADETS
jgi:hypothetical protein